LIDSFDPLSLLNFRFRGLSERRQLNNLRGFFELTGLCALAVDTVAGDRQGTMKIVNLIAVEANRLLAAPAKPFRPRRMAEHHTLCARMTFDDDLDSFVFTRGIKNL
jgi:hypothetical protein